MWNAASLRTACLVWAVAFTLLLSPSAFAVTIDWVTVGDPGNPADTNGFGAVADVYRIGRTEVTNAQYAEFLNAVAAADPNGLYNTEMGNPSTSTPFGSAPGFGGITRSGSPGSFTYSTIAGRENLPVNHVSVYDSLRFANWLHNGQPTGAQGSSTTEDGAYTFSGLATVSGRNAGATIFLPSENEWYKAAYFDAVFQIYNDFPTTGATSCAPPSPAPNTANCLLAALGDLSNAGSYTGSASPNGTFDQGGNVWEYVELLPNGSLVMRGGDFRSDPSTLAASTGRAFTFGEWNFQGFRVAAPIPEPGTGLLLMTGVFALAAWRRRRA